MPDFSKIPTAISSDWSVVRPTKISTLLTKSRVQWYLAVARRLRHWSGERRLVMMKNIKLLACCSLVTVSLLGPASSVLARDYWHWSKDHNRWDRRARR